jgi:hypothetical protein
MIVSERLAYTSCSNSSVCPENTIDALSTVAADIYVDSADVIHTQQGAKRTLGGELSWHSISET